MIDRPVQITIKTKQHDTNDTETENTLVQVQSDIVPQLTAIKCEDMLTQNADNNQHGKHNGNNSCKYFCGLCCGIIGSLIGILLAFSLWTLLIAFPFSILVLTWKYESVSDCDSSIVPISVWTYATGSLYVYISFFYIIYSSYLLTDSQRLKMILKIGAPFLKTIECFLVIWSVIGGVSFWNECSNMKPYVFNVMMWVILIVTYVQFFASAKMLKKIHLNEI